MELGMRGPDGGWQGLLGWEAFKDARVMDMLVLPLGSGCRNLCRHVAENEAR